MKQYNYIVKNEDSSSHVSKKDKGNEVAKCLLLYLKGGKVWAEEIMETGKGC